MWRCSTGVDYLEPLDDDVCSFKLVQFQVRSSSSAQSAVASYHGQCTILTLVVYCPW